MSCGFRSSVEVLKLRKQLPVSGSKARVFRCLGADIGETWMFRILLRDGTFLTETVMDQSPNHLDRRDYFKTANLENGYYVVRDRLDDVTFVFDISELER